MKGKSDVINMKINWKFTYKEKCIKQHPEAKKKKKQMTNAINCQEMTCYKSSENRS